jgi:hypothetical protein
MPFQLGLFSGFVSPVSFDDPDRTSGYLFNLTVNSAWQLEAVPLPILLLGYFYLTPLLVDPAFS